MPRHASKRLKTAPRRLTPEYVAARALAESPTLKDAASRVLQAICEGLDWEHGALWTVDAAQGLLRCVQTWQLPAVNVRQFDEVSRAITFTEGVVCQEGSGPAGGPPGSPTC